LYFDGAASWPPTTCSVRAWRSARSHLPLAVPDDVVVKYVDRLTVAQLRNDYPELADCTLVEADIIDNGEILSTVADGSQDFIVANHFLEHCEDPIAAIQNHLGKLREGGILFYAVPDKRYTFDWPRPVTSLEHMIADHEGGPERSRSEHYEEWARFVEIRSGETNEQTIARARQLERDAYSIHMHVWTRSSSCNSSSPRASDAGGPSTSRPPLARTSSSWSCCANAVRCRRRVPSADRCATGSQSACQGAFTVGTPCPPRRPTPIDEACWRRVGGSTTRADRRGRCRGPRCVAARPRP
jgi:hypothetical protein